MRAQLLLFSTVMFCAAPAFAISNDDLRAALEQRFKDDRTGACVAAGVIDNGTIATRICIAPIRNPSARTMSTRRSKSALSPRR